MKWLFDKIFKKSNPIRNLVGEKYENEYKEFIIEITKYLNNNYFGEYIIVSEEGYCTIKSQKYSLINIFLEYLIKDIPLEELFEKEKIKTDSLQEEKVNAVGNLQSFYLSKPALRIRAFAKKSFTPESIIQKVSIGTVHGLVGFITYDTEQLYKILEDSVIRGWSVPLSEIKSVAVENTLREIQAVEKELLDDRMQIYKMSSERTIISAAIFIEKFLYDLVRTNEKNDITVDRSNIIIIIPTLSDLIYSVGTRNDSKLIAKMIFLAEEIQKKSPKKILLPINVLEWYNGKIRCIINYDGSSNKDISMD